MTITQLEYIIAVDTYRSFGEAAKKCFVTQPTLSMQIKKLEEELNVLVFDRSKKPVLTTDIGRKIVEQARVTVLEASRIKEVIHNQKDEVQGLLRVGIIPTLSPYLLPIFITRFTEKYPDVTVSIEELLTEQIVEKLDHDLLDVGILVTPLKVASLVEVPLFYEPFLAYSSKSYAISQKPTISFKDLNLNDVWLLKEGHCFRNQVINICGDKLDVADKQLQFESGSLETLKKIVEQQDGFTLLPELATLDFPKEKRQYLKAFNAPQPIREVSLIIHRTFLKKKLIELFRAEILENIPSRMLQKEHGRVIPWK
ncbi:MAG: LysR substrate-binding domain-containing protein [Bacteroidota bacterium]